MRAGSNSKQQAAQLPIAGAKQLPGQRKEGLYCKQLLSYVSLLVNILAICIIIRWISPSIVSSGDLLRHMQDLHQQATAPFASFAVTGHRSSQSSSSSLQSSDTWAASVSRALEAATLISITQDDDAVAIASSGSSPASALLAAAEPNWCTSSYTVPNWQKQQVAVCNMSICAGRAALTSLQPFRVGGAIRRRWSASDKAQYMQLAFETGHIGGWLEEPHVHWIEDLSAAQHALGIFGAVAEIGVQHGKFFLPIVGFAAQQEPAVAIDLFENQQDNVDASGLGSRELLQQHLHQLGLLPAPAGSRDDDGNTFAGRTLLPAGSSTAGRSSNTPTPAATRAAADVLLLTANSMSLTASNFSSRGLPRFRLVSVDGGHSLENTLHDLQLASCLVEEGGIVVLDDYPAAHWQGVIEAAVHFSLSQKRLQLFMVGHNKAYFITASHRGAIIRHMLQRQQLYGCRPFHESRRVLGGTEFCFAGPEGEAGELLLEQQQLQQQQLQQQQQQETRQHDPAAAAAAAADPSI